MFDREEYERWLDQALYTLKSAENDIRGGFYSWACFKAQQAAEYAVKAALFGFGIMAYGHSIKKLLDVLSQRVDVPEELFDVARLLDRHYIPPRYPDAYVEGAPHEYYGKNDALEAINAAKRVIEFVGRVDDEAR
ncbi:DNA-binding protein [Thermococcus profundus]|uniref:DNA-binding protein n=1 Tax=Thermococcus profundus TaxID=49899 RepID=A0A2Z2MAM3_THEPR|nr:HEPN domain-containing protein [Thermococcus profundus]ASJ02489.1 DNA-binding protein [Thermococcus profundus]